MKIVMQFSLTISSDSFSSACGLEFLGDCHIGPPILLAQISGLLEGMSFNMRLHIWFQHNSAPPSYSHEVYQWMSENHLGCWISQRFEAPVS
jgi:hypothetical protein